MFDRVPIVDQAFRDKVSSGDFPVSRNTYSGSNSLTADELIGLFDSQVMSRHLDFMARKSKGKTFYSIGSSGHEGTASVAKASRATDMAFLHYRDGAFLIQRKKQTPGLTPLYDMALSFAASSEDPISGGRHKVLGCAHTFVPPQTSTIASHLPKAMGAAHSLGLAKKLKLGSAVLPEDAVIICSFGDASVNHSTAQGAFNAAAWASFQSSPMPIVFICEDNGIGVSVPTPAGWVEANFSQKPGIKYMACDGLDLIETYQTSCEAIDYARKLRKPVFLHMRTVRLMGHAGADIEAGYATLEDIEAAEANDPLLHTARILVEHASLSQEDIVSRYDDIGVQVNRVAEEAFQKPKLNSAAEVMSSIIPDRRDVAVPALPAKEHRDKVFAKDIRRFDQPLPLAKHITFALADLMLQYDNVVLFGEDVARKGGVYGVTQGLQTKFGRTRVFDTLLDEQTILGTAIGMAQNGFVPIPEIQFLAYLHNAEDQVRGEAATLSFFSNGQYVNPMVVRIAGLAYQRGFGGHFHNDNSLNVLRDIPGVIVACPSNGADAGPMLRTCLQLAHEQGRVVLFVEPIALYQTADLHEPDDNQWLSKYVEPNSQNEIAFGEPSVHGKGKKICVISYGNGYYLSRKAQKVLQEMHNVDCQVVDLRWLQPVNEGAILSLINDCESVLIVDECRRTGSLSEQLVTLFHEKGFTKPVQRITAEDSFIPLGPAAYHVLPSVETITDAALSLVNRI